MKINFPSLFLFLFLLIWLNRAQIFITDCDGLQNMKNNLATSYELLNDIDCQNITNFFPVGNFSTRFSGSFNGNYHEIKNVKINSSSSLDGVGIFGGTQNALISNLNIVDLTLFSNATDHVGALAGFSTNTSFTNINLRTTLASNNNSITGKSTWNVGGLVGYLQGSQMDNITIQNTIVEIQTCSPYNHGGFIIFINP